MWIRFDDTGTIDAFERIVVEVASISGVEGIMVLGCDENAWVPGQVSQVLRSLKIPLFGAIFPKIIYGGLSHNHGLLVVGLPVAPELTVVPGLSEESADYEEMLSSVSSDWLASGNAANETIFVFVDGLSKRIAALVEALFITFGLDRNFIGGGAGSLSFKQKPCLITPDGLLADSALVVRLAIGSGIGVSHGWESISSSMKVTEAERNVIHSLDWRPAFQVYRELVERHSGCSFDDHDFFSLAKCYPFGISKLGGDMIVRDPLALNEQGSLVCVGEVSRGSFVHLLNGTPQSLIAAARKASRLSEESAPPGVRERNVTFFIDCISRALFLGDHLPEEFAAVAGETGLFGAMTLGEIANNGCDYLEFYNKTAVVARLADPPEPGLNPL